jgi:hypothetical protein
MNRFSFSPLRRTVCAAALALALPAAHAWTDKPVRMVVPAPAGGTMDVVARIVADKAFVKAVADKQDYLETKWAASAQVKGLKDPKAVLAEFRAEIAKVK